MILDKVLRQDSKRQTVHQVVANENGLVRITLVGDITANDLESAFLQLRQHEQHAPFALLADIRKIGSHTITSRRVGLKIMDDIGYKKFAIVVAKRDKFTAKITEIIRAVSRRRGDVAQFTSERRAISWLKSS